MSDEKVQVRVSIRGEARWVGEVEMSRAEYEEWCERIDDARGHEQDRVANEVMDRARIDFRDVDVDDLEVDDFFAPSVTVVVP